MFIFLTFFLFGCLNQSGKFLIKIETFHYTLHSLARVSPLDYIEITSWKARTYGIFTRVGEVFITLIIICETEIREINTSLAIQCMQACTQGCYKTINTDFKRNNTPFVLNISQRSSEGRISLFGF